MDEFQEHVDARFYVGPYLTTAAELHDGPVTACADCGTQIQATAEGDARTAICHGCYNTRLMTVRQAATSGFHLGL